jgi:hypothetical protein
MHGNLEVESVTKGTKAVLYIHRQGWTKKNSHKVEGKIMDANGNVKYEVNGTWNDKLSLKNSSTGEEEVVFNINPMPENYKR